MVPAEDDPRSLVDAALDHDKFAVARLISLFEDRRPDAAARRAAVIDALDDHPRRGGDSRPSGPTGTIIGLTGTPGSGKSSLLSRLTVDLLDADDDLSIAVVAVDPSSHVSGGALLGDRTRMRFQPDERRLFFRSQASDSDLGGLGPSSFQVCRLLTRLFDCVMIETVGIGQSEADIRHLADRVYLVLQPLGGDEVQFLKAGIIEVPHAFVLNKSDEPSSSTSYHHLRSSMWLARPFDEEEPPIFRTSALTGDGLAELEADIAARIAGHGGTDRGGGLAAREPYFFERWVDDEWGRHGLRFLAERCGGAATYLRDRGGYDSAQGSFGDELLAHLRG